MRYPVWTMELEAELADRRQATREALELMEELMVRTRGVADAHASMRDGPSMVSIEIDVVAATAEEAAVRAAGLVGCGGRYAGLGTPAVRMVSVARAAEA